MSKRRRRDRKVNSTKNMQNMNNMGNFNSFRGNMNNPFGINPQKLLSMLGGNMDMSGLSNILSSMNTEGFDLSSINNMMGWQNNNTGNYQNNVANNQSNNSSGEEVKFNEHSNEVKKEVEKSKEDNKDLKEKIKSKNIDEENIQFLINLKEIVDDKKGVFIDDIINLLINSD